MNQSKKSFKYDVLITREDICDREDDIRQLGKASLSHQRIVLLAPRRYGKTSLVKNVVAVDFKKARKKGLVIYIDLMEVKSLESIAKRLQHGIAKSLTEQFSAKSLLQRLTRFFKKLSVSLEVDPISGKPSFSLTANNPDQQQNVLTLLDSIEALSSQYSLLLILDEFQDISFVSEAQALFRSSLQKLSKSSVFILGSKRHLLEDMFGNSRAPLFQYGDERHLKPIALEKWLPYFRERLSPHQIRIQEAEMQYIMKKLCDVPNAICELGAWLVDSYQKKTLTIALIQEALNSMVEQRQTYAYRLQGYTENEKKILSTIAQSTFVLSPQSSEFLQQTGLSKSGVAKIVQKLMDLGLLEYELEHGYRLSDPVLGHYLATR